jgi:hypothetical protein
MTRRQCFATLPAAAAAAQTPPLKLELKDYRPKRMLHLPETEVERVRFPAIGIHTHLTFAPAGPPAGNRRYATLAELLEVMDRKKLRTPVHLTGGNGGALQTAAARYDRAHPGRFLTFTGPLWKRASEPGYAPLQPAELGRASQAGARGLKVSRRSACTCGRAETARR